MILEYGGDDFHIRLADGYAKGAFGHAFLALQCSETLREGIHRVAYFKPLVGPIDWRITESETTLDVQIQSRSADFLLTGVYQIISFLWLVKSCRNVTGKHLVPIQTCIVDAVPYQTEIEQDLGCPIKIGRSAHLQFSQQAMDTRVLSANRYVAGALDDGMLKKHPNPGADDALVATTYNAVMDCLPSGKVTLERVARQLGLSKRTLERRLAEHQCHFHEIVRDCRRDLASHYLSRTPLAIPEVSLLLGYRETNSFYRAFKDWHGCTPLEFRHNASAKAEQSLH
jgi:AraC-like DNA-binding protein